MSARGEVPLVIAFIDLTGWAAQAMRVTDDVLAAVIDGWYEQVGATVAAAGGRVVKLIGDAALIVFPIDRADDGVAAMLALADAADAYFGAHGWDCGAHVKIHAGPCIAGDFGAAGDKRFDVIGRAVNAAAMLDSTGVALSADAYAALSPAVRARFKEHAPPVTYMRLTDQPRFRRR